MRHEQQDQARGSVARRGILTGIGVLVAGILTRAGERVAQAAGNGASLTMGNNDDTTNAPTNETRLVHGSGGSGGYAFHIVDAPGTSSAVRAESGVLTANLCFPFAGYGDGVLGFSGANQGFGVRGIGGTTSFLNGLPTVAGVVGQAQTANGAVGVFGDGRGIGVQGIASTAPGSTGNGTGVLGQSNSGVGVQGASNGNVGVLGSSSASHALYGSSINGYGLYATSTNSTGIVASTNGGNAIQGASNGNVGVLGTSQQQHRRLLRLRHEHRPVRHRPGRRLRGALRRAGAGERQLHGDRRQQERRRAAPGRHAPAAVLRGVARELVRGLRPGPARQRPRPRASSTPTSTRSSAATTTRCS